MRYHDLDELELDELLLPGRDDPHRRLHVVGLELAGLDFKEDIFGVINIRKF